MKIQIFKDNTLPIDLVSFCKLMNSLCLNIEFINRTERFHIKESFINYPSTLKRFSQKIKKARKDGDLNYFLTHIKYDNNCFLEGKDDMIISFNGWNGYTEVPISNGLAYFIASDLAQDFEIGTIHHKNIGCLNDYWWVKPGIDLGMKSAHLCNECRKSKSLKKSETKLIYEDILRILDLVSNSSRKNIDILENELIPNKETKKYDVFICHNSEDKPYVRLIKEALQKEKIRTWMDEDQLEPGSLWQEELENQISKIRNAAVFIGEKGIGPWHNQEIRAFLSEMVNRDCKVIPVILPNAKSIPDLPLFLKQITWLDLRKDYPLGIQKLIKVIK